ncbi:MAG: sugar ABC transporter permease [Chloroflexi bacterium]|nr:sugar ABC transporter permease [Chloroflexota bacterium]
MAVQTRPVAARGALTPHARRRHLERQLTAYLFVGPALLVMLAFIVYPAVYSFLLSFHEWNGFTPEWGPFVGLANYVSLVQDEIFWKAAVNSVLFVVVRTPLEVGIAFVLALLLNREMKGRGLLRTLFFVPVVLSLIVVTIMFQRILEPNAGLLNVFLRSIGLDVLAQAWLGDPAWALPTVIAISIWKNVGFSMVILLAGLQGLPGEVLEAARVDGADRRQLTLKIITPLMKPILGIAIVLSVIGGLKVFDLVFILTRGGPTYATEVFATMLYRQAFDLNEMGIASALAMIMVLLIMGTSWLQTLALRER